MAGADFVDSLISNIMLSNVRAAYENLALPVFRRHGGRFERTLSPLRVAGDSAEPDEPDEIRVTG